MIGWFKSFFTPPVPEPVSVHKALNRNGAIIRLAQLEGRSLTHDERETILAVRKVARDEGRSASFITVEEFAGMQDRRTVHKPFKTRLKFAYWTSPQFGRSASASFTVVRSDHPVLLVGQTFNELELIRLGIAVPSAPSYDKWVKRGRKLFLRIIE